MGKDCGWEKGPEMQKAVGRETELTRTSEFMRHIFVHLGQISSRLGQGGLTWRGQLKTQVGTTGRGDTAETSPLMPNPTALLPCCYFPIHYYPPRPCSHTTSSRKPSKMPPFRLTFSLFIPCHTSLHHSPHLFLSLCLPIQLEAWCPAGMQQGHLGC